MPMKKWVATKLAWARRNPLFFLNALFFPFSVFMFFENSYQSLGLRVWGSLLQLVGVIIVGMDLAGAARYYKRESLWKNTANWLLEGLGKKHAITLGVEAGISMTFAPGVALGTHGPASDSVEDRLIALEKNVEIAHSRITRVDTKVGEVSREFKDDLRKESKTRAKDLAQLHNVLKDAAIGNYAMLQFGGVWLVVGMIFTTFPDELLSVRNWLATL
ncbi:MAG: hypothetical protein PGN26_11480 [Xylophilus ampelinus]